jgi:hypothetical protein
VEKKVEIKVYIDGLDGVKKSTEDNAIVVAYIPRDYYSKYKELITTLEFIQEEEVMYGIMVDYFGDQSMCYVDVIRTPPKKFIKALPWMKEIKDKIEQKK